MASFRMIGQPHHAYANPNMMFDGIIRDHNMYHSAACAGAGSDYAGIIITFPTLVEFADLELVTRTDCCPERYNNVCLYADGVQIGCTPSDLNPINLGVTLNFKDYTHTPATAQEFKLNWENEHCMQIAELYLHYKGIKP